MGLLDKFKKNNNTIKNVPNKEEVLPYSFSRSEDGKLQVDFHDPNPEFKNFYDSTRLIIDERGEDNLTNCRVSWYSTDDCVMIDENGRQFGRKDNYSSILTKIDLSLLKNDPIYTTKLMRDLLKQNRVESYLEKGMMEKPDRPCGNYIGSIYVKDGEYKKIFEYELGAMIHNSPEMVEKRQRAKERMNAQRENEIRRKQEEIKRLQSEIDGIAR